VSLIALKEDIMSNSNIESSYDDDRDDHGSSSSDEDGLKADKKNQLGDFYFGDAEIIDPLGAEHDQYDCMGLQMDSKTVEEDNDWEVPTESITLRHEITHQPIVDEPFIPEMTPVSNKKSKK